MRISRYSHVKSFCDEKASAILKVPTVSLPLERHKAVRGLHREDTDPLRLTSYKMQCRKATNYLHVSSHYRNTRPFELAVLKYKSSLEFHLRARLQSASLRTDQDVLEVQLNVILDSRHDARPFCD